MNIYTTAAQFIIAASIIYVWVFRFNNIIIEFKQYQLSDLVRSSVGAAKMILATLLVTGIWYVDLVFVPTILMALLMVAAQYFHFKVKNPWKKHVPSFALLLLCIFIVLQSGKII